VYTWDYMGPEQEQQAAQLPIEGVLALLELMAALELSPWGMADETAGNMPTLAFGQGRGLVTVLILDYRREMVITRIQWAG
jgi:hypothetical protein